MNLSAPFIRRPVATTLLTLGVALAGIVAFQLLPVAPLPQVDYPTISVQARMPGASPETMAATVATPLERALGRIAGISEITSQSSLGSSRVTLQFNLDRDIDGAARDVQAAINAARSLLPTGLPNNPTYRKVNPAESPILILALTSESMTQGQMYDAASTILAQKFSQVKGIGQVNVGGSSLPAVRVELNPAALNKYGVDFETVRIAIATTNANRPKGMVEDGDRSWQIYANDQAKKAADYLPLIVSFRNGAPVRLTDLGEVVDSVEDLRNAGSVDGRPSVLIILNRQPGANIIETADRIKALLPQMRASIPAAINLRVALDRTPTIRASLREVERTLVISMVLVILVVFAFLRNVRAALIPSVAVPVSLLGTFAAMYLLGYSLNNLSLMALTIATGFVVDDAIVVLENVTRHIESGMPRMQAALHGAREVGFTVLSMSLSLIAVFIPILLMGGIVGRLFREFAVTLSVAILVSLVLSLTTTPMMCAHMLKVHGSGEGKRRGLWARLDRIADAGFNGMHHGYEVSLGWALRHGRIMLTILAATIALNIYLYVIVPKGFFPQQDTGRLNGFIQADQSISFQAMRPKLAQFIEIVRQDPAVETVMGFTGGGQRNTGFMFVSLKPLAERQVSAEQVIARLRVQLARVPGANLFLNAFQDIRVGGRSANAQYQFTLQADDLEELRTWEPRIRQAISPLPELADVNTDSQDKGMQTSLVIDRDAASRLGITPRMIDTVLNNAFGQRQVSNIYNPLNQYHVVMEAAPPHWQSPESLKDVYVIAPGGAQVPLAAFARYEPTNTRLAVNHQSQFASSTISFNLPPNVSLSEATDAITLAMQRLSVPGSIIGNFQGTARAFQASLASQPWLILTALLTVYIVLGMLYESTVHPITILSTLPSAGIGALLALLASGTELNIIALIGVILLIGIVKKNAIMMIDFALAAERTLGLAPREAIFHACLRRFRPIMMTTLSALLGAIPLALAFGEGTEIRRPLGIAIVGGLILSQILTLYTTPVVYLYLDRLRHWALRSKAPGGEGAAPGAGFRRMKIVTRLNRYLSSLALLVLFMAGCTVGPDYVRPSVEVPDAFGENPSWKTAEPRDHEARGKWWEMFADSVLNGLQEEVNISNQTLMQAEANYRQAAALIQAADAANYPTLTGALGVTRSRASSTTVAAPSATPTSRGVVQNDSLRLDATWLPDFWGRVRRSVEASVANAQASAALVETARLSAQAQLAQSYFQLRVLDGQRRLYDEIIAAYGKALQITQNQYTAGVTAKADVIQAQAQLKTIQAQAIDLGVQRAQLEHAIAVLVGKPPAAFHIAPAALKLSPPRIPPVLPAALLERRPDIATAERRVAAANAQIGVARAAFFPNVTLPASVGFQSAQRADWFTLPSRFWSIGPSLVETLFDAGLRRSQSDQAIAAYDASVAAYRQAVLVGFQQVEDNLAALRVLEQEAAVQDEAVKASSMALELSLNQYRAGLISFLPVVVAQNNALANLRTQSTLLGLRMTASVQLVAALGGDWSTAALPAPGELRQPDGGTRRQAPRQVESRPGQ